MPHNTIPLPEADYLYINPSQLPNAGNGLYTAIPIYKGEVVAIYKGKILTQPQAKLKAAQGTDQYFINLPNGTIMDSMPTACFAKYANDATGQTTLKALKNNTKIALNHLGRPCLIATRTIPATTEIFCSYGKRYWAKHGSQLTVNS